MGTIQRMRASWLVGAFGACMLAATAAHGQIATERPGSILMFPKVVRDGTRDTVIQITNTSNMPNYVRCYYLDGSLDLNGQPRWTIRDFELVLTKQQPTHWRAGDGRKVDIFSPFGSEGAGLDPGLIPPVPVGFAGALVCAEVLPDFNLPAGRNNLKGEATIQGPAANQSKYNAIAVPALAMPSADNTLDLNNTEYSACAASSRLNFVPDGSTDLVIEALGNAGICTGDPTSPTNGQPCNSSLDCASITETCDTGLSSVVTNLTVLPCNLDFQNGLPSRVTLQFEIRDEFETPLSASTTVDCWGSFNLGGPGLSLTRNLIPTQFATARIFSAQGGPFVAIAESFHTDSIGNTASAAVNLHVEGTENARIILSDNF